MILPAFKLYLRRLRLCGGYYSYIKEAYADPVL